MPQNDRTMETVAGIKYTKGVNGGRGFVLIDLDIHGDNELLEDFLDLMELKSRNNNETISLDEFNRYIDKRVEMNV